MKKVKTYEQFNEEVNLKKGLAGLALGASLLGGQSCVKTEIRPVPVTSTKTEVTSNDPNSEAGPIFMQVKSGGYKLEYYSDDNTFTYDREISELLSTSPAYTITRKFSIRSGTFNYEYVLFEGNSKYKYTGNYQVYNYNEDIPSNFIFTLYSGGPTMGVYHKEKLPEIGEVQQLPNEEVELENGKVIITINRERIK